ncbi:MAG TPA: IS5 family transposase [Candidatus Cloacimonadota bacterium]|nr:IS5 family transposase [Candidatus Cloacimonadota bacterium]
MEKQTITFADQEIANRLANRRHFLKDVELLLDWKRINKILSKVEIRKTSVAGRDAFSAEVMFRIMLIQSWYKLSDYQMEEQLFYNNMFLWFCHLSLENPVPDHSTICRWRTRFSEKGVQAKLLQEINHQLSKHNIKINEGVIVDATIVESHARPRKKEIIETEPVGDDEIPGQIVFQTTELTTEESKDPDARWIKKGKRSTYGFKGHTVVDVNHGLVQVIKVTPANVFDGQMLKPLLDSVDLPENIEVLADKGYCSQENEDKLKDKQLVSGIMRKKKKNQEMAPESRAFNHAISSKRYRVEQSFGSLKKHFGWSRSIYIGLQKTADYLIMGAIAFNLKRSLKILRA